MAAYKKPREYKRSSTNNTVVYPYPSDNINPSDKRKKEYYLKVAEAFYSEYVNGECAVPFEFGEGRSIDELRKYAKGKQSSDKIKSWVLSKRNKNNDGTYTTLMNVSWQGYAKLPQLFDIMRSKNMSQEYDVALTCVDENSLAAIDATRKMMKFYLNENTVAFAKKAMYKSKPDVDPEELGLQNDADVDMYIDTGGFTLQWQMAAIAACNKSKIVSDYKEFQDSIFDDLIINPEGVCGAKTYIEKSTGLPKFVRIPMSRAVVPASDFNNFKDITRAGYLRIMSIADIRKENPDLKPEHLIELAKNFSWMNPALSSVIAKGGWYGVERQGYNTMYDIEPISSAKVLVFDFQFLSTDIEVNIKNEDRGFFKEVDFDTRLTAKDKKNGDRLVKKRVIRKYECQWIVGTEHFLTADVCNDQIYYGEDGNKTPSLDFHFAKTGNMSLVERCIAIVDDMDMILVKHRNAWATLPAAPAMAIQKDLIEGVFLNGIMQSPEDIMDGLIQRGVLYYNSLDDHGKPLFMAGGQKPIDYMDVSKMTQMLSVCTAELANKVSELKDVLGLQGGVDGGDRNPYQGLGETELAFQASNASLQPTFNAYNYLFKSIFNDIIKKWQIVAKDKSVKVSYSVLGNKNLKMLELGKDFTAAEFNCDVTIAPSNEEKQSILQSITEQRALAVQTNGAQGITISQYLFLFEKIMAGNIKEAYFVLARMEAKQAQQAARAKAQDQEFNITSQQASAAAKADMDKQNIELKAKYDTIQTLVEGMMKSNLEMQKILTASRKETDSSPNEALANQIIAQNTQDTGSLMAELEPETNEQQQGELMPQQEEQVAMEAPPLI